MDAVGLSAKWRGEAATLRAWSADAQAAVLERCAADLEAAMRAHDLEALTLEEAVAESGYSYSALEKLLRSGGLENAGAKGKPRIRRGDLPRKARRPTMGIADTILQRRAAS